MSPAIEAGSRYGSAASLAAIASTVANEKASLPARAAAAATVREASANHARQRAARMSPVQTPWTAAGCDAVRCGLSDHRRHVAGDQRGGATAQRQGVAGRARAPPRGHIP